MNKKQLKKVIISEQKELVELLNKWDPIGICPGEVGPEDEYDCFVGPIITILHKGGNKEELTKFLIKHLEEHMGLDSKYNNPEEFADKVMNWWSNRKI